MKLNEIISFKNTRYSELERFGKISKQFLAWKFIDSIPTTALSILQSAEFRVKNDISIQRNFNNKLYSEFETPAEISDLVGIRIVAYFLDDLVKFCNKENIFQLFGKKAKTTLEYYTDEYGYRSYHFEIELDCESELYHYLRKADLFAFSGIICEVQARTIIQHAFAESNHQLNYKYEQITNKKLPDEAKNIWANASIKLDGVDQSISALKKQWAEQSEFRKPQNMNHQITFKYQGKENYSQYNCLTINNVIYGYQMQLEFNKDEIPEIVVDEEFFNIDKIFEKVVKVEKYKSRMWRQLEQNKPESIARITHDSMVPRIVDWDCEQMKLTVQRAMYSDQVVSNHKFALNEIIPESKNIRVRELAFTEEGLLKSFSASPFSNTIGVSCIVRTQDEKWLLSHRGTNVAYDPGILGCSASGALEWDELGNWGEKDFLSWFAAGLIREYVEELGADMGGDLKSTDLGNRIIFLGFGREIERCGKPQMFFFIKEPTKTFKDLKQMWRIYADNVIQKEGQMPEFKDIIGVDTETLLELVSADEAKVINAIKKSNAGSGISEEIRTNAVLALKYCGLT